MFDKDEVDLLTQAIEMYIASNKRARNTSKRPEFNEIYNKIEAGLLSLRAKIITPPVQKPK